MAAGKERSSQEPFVRIVRRGRIKPLYGVLIRAAAILLATLVTFILVQNVGGFSFGDTAKYLFVGAFENSIKVNSFLKEACMLLFFAIALTPAFKMRFWNIGAQGQVLFGGLAAAALMFYFGNKLPNAALLPIMVVSSILAGAVWAGLPAFFRVKYATNETLFTLMMNYVAIQLVACMADLWKGQKSSLGIIDRMAGRCSALFGNKYGWIYLLTVVFTVAMYIYMTRTKQGYEIAVVGESVNTARYAGINNKAVIFRTVALSGAICGLIGFLYVSCINWTISTTTGGSYGFTAIIVAWLAKFNPIFMTLISALLAFLQVGAVELVNRNVNLNASVGEIIVSIYLFFILGCEFFVNYRLVFHFSSFGAKEGKK